MLYYLFDFINKNFNPPGFDVFRYLTFRSALSAITALFLALYFGPKIIRFLQKHQIGEAEKVDAPKTHLSKAGTPTMGGLILIASIIIPVLLWSDIENIYIVLALVGTVFLSGIGFLDDYLKVIKKLPNGLIARYKLLGQIIVGLAIYFSPQFEGFNTLTTVPFLKNVNLDLSYFYIPSVIFIVAATSNAVNLTDGLDGLAIGISTIVMLALAVISYISGNAIYANYLSIIYQPGSGELTVFIAAVIGASLGFLWFNLSRRDFYGRYGFAGFGRCFWNSIRADKKRIAYPDFRRCLLFGNHIGNNSKGLFQIHKKEIRTGKKSF